MKTGFGVWTRTASIVSIAVFDRETISPQMMFMWWTPPKCREGGAERADREWIDDGCNYGRSLLSRLITLLPLLSPVLSLPNLRFASLKHFLLLHFG